MSQQTSKSTQKDWVNLSQKKRKRRSRGSKKSPEKPKPHKTVPKARAPPSASTIYCQWYQQGKCTRGKDCFFIHAIDPNGDISIIEHNKKKEQLKKLRAKQELANKQTVFELKKPNPIPDFESMQFFDYPPSYPYPMSEQKLNPTVAEFLPQNTQTYNPYLHYDPNFNYDYMPNTELKNETYPVVNENEIDPDDYEVFEDENGEIIIVKKDELYGDDPDYLEEKHHTKMLKDFNKKRDDKKISKRRQKKNKNDYAAIASKNLIVHESTEEEKSETENPDYNPKAKVCAFWQLGSCIYGDHCRNAHRFEDSFCALCFQDIGKDVDKQHKHMKICKEKQTVEKENEISKKAECGICRENVLSRGQKFGLLTGCDHAFCLSCIREWRGVINQSKSAIRGCPVCRQISYFILPFHRLVQNPKRKDAVTKMYKAQLKKIRCKHYDDNGDCPFGSSCFYKHINKDGTEEKVEKLRHRVNDKAETEIMRAIQLSDMFDGLFSD